MVWRHDDFHSQQVCTNTHEVRVILTLIFFLRYYVQQSHEIDFVADSLWTTKETANNITLWLNTDNVRYIFIPIHYLTGHFALALLHCGEKKCFYLDPSDGGNIVSFNYNTYIILYTAFTTSKQKEVQNLLASLGVTFEVERVTVRTQKNPIDCGLHVVSYVCSATQNKSMPPFDVVLEREKLFSLVFKSLPTVC